MRRSSRPILLDAIGALVLVALTACGGGGEPGEPGDGVDTTAVSASDTADPAPLPETPAAAPEREVSGQAVFSANCATCHGDSGEGNGPAATGLEPPPADLTDGTWVTGDGSIDAIVNTIENGSPGTAMIAWEGTLTEPQIEAVARYVKSLGGS